MMILTLLAKKLMLKVPSALVTQGYNFLLNPAHAKASQVKIIDKQPFSFLMQECSDNNKGPVKPGLYCLTIF